ncbi:amino acid permease [Paraconexibacter antarcticus]|uniref:Amino acid permease n=1 Tax=Paraconexibacter antarcticus TaxID=2949664 RepID=A0ABY5DMU8_9ACTN|nr:amino acid permease [Paraconexibacter antarcticus]UTI62503.1 amino acid permease [Paraconexibacter antarcticus]
MSGEHHGFGEHPPETAPERAAEAAFDAVRTTVGSPVLFAVVWTALASGIYFSLGVVADHALGLTPVVFLIASGFFGLATMTYVEGASLHQDKGGSTVFARYAFNELWSFIAGWAVLLDYIILIAVCAFTATNYAAAFWAPLGRGAVEIAAAIAVIVYVAGGTIRGFQSTRARRLIVIVVADLALQLALVVVGLAIFFDGHVLTSDIHLGSTPKWSDAIFALGVATVVLTGLESASGLAGEVGVRRAGLKRLVASSTAFVVVIYTGIAMVAVMAIPAVRSPKPLDDDLLNAPVLGIADAFHQEWLRSGAKYALAAAATVTLIGAANSAMLGLSRLGYSLSLNRQIPSAVGRLHPTRSTPYVVIVLAAVMAIVLVIPADLDLLVGIYAFGSLLGLTIAHASVVRLRFTEPDRRRPYAVPFSVPFKGRSLPLPSVLGAGLAVLAWVSVIVFHSGARYVGLGWMGAGIALYVVYRTTQEKSVFQRITVPEQALRQVARPQEVSYGSILVPLMGSPLDDDIIQTAGRLAGEEHEDFDDEEGAVVEALWIIEVPMSLPIDARLPDGQLDQARAALRRAKAVGEEYVGVEVATATIRTRRAGQAIVEEAQRRGVEAIVMAAEEPSRIRGGARLGGRGGPRDNFVGEITKYVVAKATCPVILTAPPTDDAISSRAPAED